MKSQKSRTFLLLFFSFLSSFSTSFGQWSEIGTLHFGFEFMRFTNPDTGVAAGINATTQYDLGLLRTTNGGLTWDTVGTAIEPIDWFGLEWSDSSTVWAAGAGGLWKSSDYGLTCSQNIQLTSVRCIFFLDSQNGFLFSNTDGLTYRTLDGGQTWTPGQDFFYTSIEDLFFLDANTGYAAVWAGIDLGDTLVYKTTNGGNTWEPSLILPTVPEAGNRIWFTDSLTGFAGTTGGFIFKTTDAGTSWNSQLVAGDNILDLQFSDAMNGIATALDDGVFITTDGGISWQVRNEPTHVERMDAIGYWNPPIAITGNYDGGLIKSMDAGVTWTSILENCIGPQSDLWFFNDNEGIVFNLYGNEVQITSDGGGSWRFVDSLDLGYLDEVWFWDNLEGIVSGDKFHKTTDGGNSWYPTQTNVTILQTTDLSFPVADTGFGLALLGSGNHMYGIFQTVNRGENWNKINEFYNPSALPQLIFTSTQTGFILKMNEILKTTDGGLTWNVVNTSNPPNSFYEFAFASPSVGYVTATNGLLRKTTNAGNSWFDLAEPAGNILRVLTPFDEDTVYFGNITGSIVKTTDGGNTWGIQLLPTPFGTSDIQFINGQSGFLTGQLGHIYKTSNGGGPVANEKPELLVTQVKVFPNPSTGQFFLVTEETIEAEVFDLKGMKIFSATFPAGQHLIDISLQPDGIYLLSIKTGKSFLSKRLIKTGE